jgi:tellurite resistance protein
MPFYIRKAISAGPFRFNLSKSGLGLSVGVKGLRFGLFGPRGNYIHAGRYGLYYRTSLNPAGQKVRRTPPLQDGGAGPPSIPATPPDNPDPSVEMVEVASGDVLAMRDARFSELLDEINSKQKQMAYATIFGVGVGAVGLGILYAVGSGVLDLGSQVDLGRQVGVAVLLLALPAWAIGRWVDSYKRRSVLFYDLDQDAAKAYEAITHAFDELMACAGKWHIEAKGAIHDLVTWKRNAGATGLVKRKSTDLAYATPKVIASNIKPPLVQFGRQLVYFFPDAAFVIDGKQVGAISYDSLYIYSEKDPFIEDGTVPADAKVIGHTWKHPNKGGGPDRRFSNNYQIPLCLYELAQFSSSSGLNELLEFSRTGVVAPLANAIKKLALQMGGQAAKDHLRLVQKAHQMLVDTKADFFKRFKECTNLSDELAEMRETIFSNFDSLVTGVLCTIASADGPINAKEADVLNLLLGVQRNELQYNEFLKSINKKATDIPKVFGSIIGVAIQLRGVEQGTNYDPHNDPVVKCFENLGQAVSSADGDINQSELASLSNFAAIAQSKAIEIARKVKSQTDAGTSNSATVASTPPIKETPLTSQQSTAQSQSGAFVSGDGGYHFEVVGESHYQADLESVAGGRTEDGANCECVAMLTPEHDNPYDPQAVSVNVNGHKVGYLPRNWAAKFDVALASNGYAQAACKALIVGGWERGGNDRGHFGIKLDIALPFNLIPNGQMMV